MTIRVNVEVGQEWQSNDPRRMCRIRVERITSSETGGDTPRSVVIDATSSHCLDRVHVINVQTGKRTTIRRDQFTTGVRGWSQV